MDTLSFAKTADYYTDYYSVELGIGFYVLVFSFLLLFFLFHLAVLSLFETSFFSLSEKEEEKIRCSEKRKDKRLRFLLASPLQTLGTIVLSYYTLLIAIIIGFVWILNHIWINYTVLSKPLYWIITFLIVTFVIFFFSEFLPDLIKKKKRISFLRRSSGFIRFLHFINYPVVKLLLRTTTIIERRLETKTYRNISIDELSETLKLTAVEKKDEQEILQGIVNFGRINVDEIMTPRVDIVDIDIKSDFETVIRTIQESEYSRLPVYENSIDNVKGILYIKDLLTSIDRDKSFDWRPLIREAYFIPETKKIDDLLKEFQTKHIHMAIIVDEFGGTSGIVTLEDVLEVIVGDICDERDVEQKLYTSIDDKNYVLEGKLLLNDFYKINQVEKECFTDIDSDADTLAGLILEIKGDIPAIGETIKHNGYIFQIVSADNRRIKKIRMQIP